MKFRIARNITKREYFEFEAADETAARAAVHQLNTKIMEGTDYDVEDLDECVFIEERDLIFSDNNQFDLTDWKE